MSKLDLHLYINLIVAEFEKLSCVCESQVYKSDLQMKITPTN